MSELQRSELSLGSADVDLGDYGAIQFGGQTYRSDETKAYFEFQFARAFPSATIYGTAFHPNVLAQSWNSILHQGTDLEHQVESLHPGKKMEDRYIGCVVAATFPQTPEGGWRVQGDPSLAPYIRGVAALFKGAKGVNKLFGDHMSGRRKLSVSMEVFWQKEESGFAVELRNGEKPAMAFTPPDMITGGWEFIPWLAASDSLRACFASVGTNPGRIAKRFENRKVIMMEGGLSNPVHLGGLGVVLFGAEPDAKLLRLAANADSQRVYRELDALADRVSAAFARPEPVRTLCATAGIV